MILTQKVKYMVPVTGGVIILVILACFMGLTLKQDQMINNYIHLSAASFFDSIVITRRWSANYGGLYVEKKEGMTSNPFLKKPDITSSEGVVYTLKNPALMTREISEMAKKTGGYQYHITSLKLMNPGNRPDDWERQSLENFEKGVKETSQVMELDGKKVYRLMRPLLFENGCVKCHAAQGYRIGEVRGGISVALPYDDIATALASNRIKMISLAMGIIFVFAAVFYFIIWRLINKLTSVTAELADQKKSLEELNAELDRKVLRRTADLKASEERFRNTFEQAAVGICHSAVDGTFLRFNHRFCDILGYSEDELRKMTFQQITHPDDLGANLQQGQKILTGAQQTFTMEKRYIKKDGSLVWCNLTVSLVRTAAGEPDYFIAVIEDMTIRRRLEKQLQQARKMEAIGTLAGGIAHDFNNILTPIVGYAELLAQELKDDATRHDAITEVLNAAFRAQQMVKQILTFSRQSEQEKAPLNAAPLIREALKLLRASIPATIDIRQKIDTNLGIIMADPTQLHQVVMNLCTNAYYAMRDSGGVMSVSLSVREVTSANALLDVPAGRYVLLEVGDTGCGIDAATRERIFEPYFTTKPQGEGTGLGLALVHGIVQGLGGGITVDSEPGRGTTFHIYLPLAESGASAIPVAPAGEGEMPRGTERILLVDDEKAITAVQTSVLSKLGYQVSAVNKSDEALDLLRARPEAFDLVITDMTMPGMTGLALAREMLIIRPRLPIILCTGFNTEVNDDRAREVGISSILAKPILRGQLALAVRKALDDAKAED